MKFLSGDIGIKLNTFYKDFKIYNLKIFSTKGTHYFKNKIVEGASKKFFILLKNYDLIKKNKDIFNLRGERIIFNILFCSITSIDGFSL